MDFWEYVPIFHQIKVHISKNSLDMNQNISKLNPFLHFEIKTNSLIFFEVHHRIKPKSIHLIVASVTYLDF